MELPRIVTRRQAEALGVSASRQRHQIDCGRWSRPWPGVLATFAGPLTRPDWIDVGLRVAGPTGVVSGWDAVRLGGVDVAVPVRSAVLVLTRSGLSRRAGPVLVRRSDRPLPVHHVPSQQAVPAFIAVASTARAIADVALSTPWDGPVVDLVTSALRQRLTDVEALTRELDAGPRNGSARLRRVLTDVGASHSVAEFHAAQILRHRRVPPFEQNAEVVVPGGRVRRVDFLWRSLRACLEIDSWKHHGTHRSWQATMDRHAELTITGLAVLHVTPERIATEPTAWADSVAAWLAARQIELAA